VNTFQTILSLVVLILALCVVVQAIQEVVKAALGTKASVMREAMNKFMGPMLPLADIKNALDVRGLGITDLERFRGKDFRQLLDGIKIDTQKTEQMFAQPQGVAVDQIKDNMAAFYESALASFQKEYTARNKLFAIVISAILVGGLNANVVILYENLSTDAIVQQAIVGKASSLSENSNVAPPNGQPAPGLGDTYTQSRKQISQVMQDYPVLLRTSQYPLEFHDNPFKCLFGLLIMIGFVSLGAPFWNDVLKSMMGINNVLNTNGSASS
jgi:hypothetical protein